MNAFIFIGLIAVMWAALIVPQQRRAKRQRELVSTLGVGDDVMLASGVYGTITGEDDDDIFLNIADGVEIGVLRAAISGKVEFEPEDDDSDTDTAVHGDDTSD
jgi:preprotein translocase subunit YajC